MTDPHSEPELLINKSAWKWPSVLYGAIAATFATVSIWGLVYENVWRGYFPPVSSQSVILVACVGGTVALWGQAYREFRKSRSKH